MARPPTPNAEIRLLEAARAEFALHGLENARVEDISKRAGFSKGTFYLYFQSKELVFERLISIFFEEIHKVSTNRHTEFLSIVHAPMSVEEKNLHLSSINQKYNVLALETLWKNRDLLPCLLDLGKQIVKVTEFIDFTRSVLCSRLDELESLGFGRYSLDKDLASDIVIGIYLHIARRLSELTEPPNFSHWAQVIDTFVCSGLFGLNKGLSENS